MLLIYLDENKRQRLVKFNGTDDFLETSRSYTYNDLQNSSSILFISEEFRLEEPVQYEELCTTLLQYKALGMPDVRKDSFIDLPSWKSYVEDESVSRNIVLQQDTVESVLLCMDMYYLCNEHLTESEIKGAVKEAMDEYLSLSEG